MVIAGQDERHLDPYRDLQLGAAVHAGGLVDLGWQRPQRGVDDDHVEADRAPHRDVRDRGVDAGRAEEVDVVAADGAGGRQVHETHSSVAITPGTAYGRKISRRAARVNRARAVSSSSANSSASPIVTGMVIAPTATIRSTLDHRSPSESTAR
jgi:hypothetical protein